MMSDDKNQVNAKDFIIGTLIGGIVGASAALFLAPKAGKELRDDLNEQAIYLRERTNELTAAAKEKGFGIADLAKDKTDEITSKVSQQSSSLVNKVKTLSASNEQGINDEQLDHDLKEENALEAKAENVKENQPDELEEDALGAKS
jgi:gas vesicle protein